MLAGSCLCGTVAFEVEGDCTAIEVCHCRRCRQAYGSGMAATVYARLDGFRWVRGAAAVKVYDAPLRERPPQYRHVFCETCGSLLPICREESAFVEIPSEHSLARRMRLWPMRYSRRRNCLGSRLSITSANLPKRRRTAKRLFGNYFFSQTAAPRAGTTSLEKE